MTKASHPRSSVGLDYLNLGANENTLWNLTPQELYEEAIKNGEAILTKDYALRVLTGKYTGRSPKDKYIVDQPSIHDDIDWGDINQPTDEETFDRLFEKVTNYLADKKLYVKDCFAGADEKYRLNVRVVSEAA
jgi:phosphoenolpyruvate carboxykinase (ATP)